MDGTPYISTDFNSVFPGSYASVSQGVHQCGGKRRRKQRKSNKQRKNRNQNKSRKQRKSNKQRKNKKQNKSRKQRKSNKQRRNNKQNKSQDGGRPRSLEKFKELLYKSSKIIDLNFNDENKFILTSEVPIITFENLKKVFDSPGAEEASIREMFNNQPIDKKLEMCNSRFVELTDP